MKVLEKILMLLNEDSRKSYVLGEPITGKDGILDVSENIMVGQVYYDKINNRKIKVTKLVDNAITGEPGVFYTLVNKPEKKFQTSLDNFADSIAKKEYILIKEDYLEKISKDIPTALTIKLDFGNDAIKTLDDAITVITSALKKGSDIIKDENGNTVGKIIYTFD